MPDQTAGRQDAMDRTEWIGPRWFARFHIRAFRPRGRLVRDARVVEFPKRIALRRRFEAGNSHSRAGEQHGHRLAGDASLGQSCSWSG
jgi:hypothetical protein